MEHIPIHKICSSSLKKNLQKFPFLYKGECYDESKKDLFLVDIASPRVYEFSSNQDHVKGNILVVPGGGYAGLSIFKEGIEVALYFSKMGYNVYLSVFRMPSREIDKNNTFLDLQNIVYKVSEKHINQDLSFICFSAGVHALLYSVFQNKSFYNKIKHLHTNYIICACIYPLTQMKRNNTHFGSYSRLIDTEAEEEQFNIQYGVNGWSLPLFVCHGKYDKSVPFNHAEYLIQQVQNKNISYMFLPLETAEHGFGLTPDQSDLNIWAKPFLDFLNSSKS